MARLRAGLRLVAFLGWSAGCLLLRLLTRPVVRIAPRTATPIQLWICRTWARGVVAILGLSVDVVGAPPPPPFVLVSNHLGYLDIVTLMAHAPAVFVSRADVSGWPVLGRLARAGGTLFLEREVRRDVLRINALMHDVLAQGLGVVVFPEGTSSGGDEVLAFRSSLLEPAVALSTPVHWAALTYATPPGAPHARDAVCWWGEMTFPDHFWRLLCLRRIRAGLRFGATPLRADGRHALAGALQDAVARGLAEMRERCADTPPRQGLVERPTPA